MSYFGYIGDDDRTRHERYARAHARRRERLEKAREKGTHTKTEWEALRSIFQACVACGIPYEALYGGEPCKDHIEPIAAGGCDCVGNLQPMCRNCNSGKGPPWFDYRNVADPNWFGKYKFALRGRE